MESKEAVLHLIRSVLVILAFILMLAVVVFQCIELDQYGVAVDDMTTRLKGVFSSSSSNTTTTSGTEEKSKEEKTEEKTEEKAPAVTNNNPPAEKPAAGSE